MIRKHYVPLYSYETPDVFTDYIPDYPGRRLYNAGGTCVFHQERLAYFPQPGLFESPENWGYTYEDVWLDTADGVRIHGWYVPAAEPRGAAIFFHGNGNNIDSNAHELRALQLFGFNTLMLDYRGYGLSEGSPIEAGLYHDADAAWRYMTETRGIAPKSIVLVGQSLGGGVATYLAQQHDVAGVVLMATFTSMADVGAEHYSFLPVHLLSRNRYPSLARLPDIQAPLLIIHSRDDRTMASAMPSGCMLLPTSQKP
ncbi:MAG: alpha/beta hydrolase [Blastochloris sp.]|nr:alpha/beta hydrolase [Blastochloris sp.]